MDIYIFFVFVLFALAISDLIVGVSNDAVNFLVSAIGSKAAPFWVIMLVASIGIVFGATFSSGMMEVARKGIFHPAMFSFDEIMVIFLAVMLTDILLLDLFNTFGMPTSTTVSIVFELLGGAVAVAFLKVRNGASGEIADFINSTTALKIISGILLSVVVAFTVGALVQYLTRLVFSFRTEKTLKYFGALWAGIAITAITYFILIKGMKGSSYASYELASGESVQDWVNNNSQLIMGVSFVIWTIILQIINWVFKINILKIVVLAGTFALAMAFAGNDLVNFIGVPLAGLKSHEAWTASGEAANMFSMSALAEKVPTRTIYLLFAGFVMVGALIFSKKSRSVTKTSLDLSRQSEGEERFGSSGLSRSVVRIAMAAGNSLSVLVPSKVAFAVNKRFEQVKVDSASRVAGADFDLIRASVNLMVASILISFGTSMKLPLSTTYVTFMVAMGTSLADGAWGRESAVYRITGVISVIGGWFLTAFIAFSVAFLVALFISWGNIYAVCIILALVVFMVYKTHKAHKSITDAAEVVEEVKIESVDSVLQKCQKSISKIFKEASKVFDDAVHGLIEENRLVLKKQVSEAKKINDRVKKQKDELHKVIGVLQQDSIETGHYYVQNLDYQREFAHCLTYITQPLFDHVDNNHKAILAIQAEELIDLANKISKFFKLIRETIEEGGYDKLDCILEMQISLLKRVEKYRKSQIKRIKQNEVGTKNSMLYLNIMMELRNLILYSVNIVKAQRDFVQFTK